MTAGNMRKQLLETATTGAERAYAAGFFDGEGAVVLSTRKGRSPKAQLAGRASFTAGVTIAQSNRPALQWFADRWGGFLQGPYVTPFGIQGHYRWQVGHRLARRFLIEVQPHVRLKALRVENALAFFDFAESVPLGRTGHSQAVYDQLKLYYEVHRSLGMGLATKKRVHVYS